ncbi:hypothetical protein [Salinisphaera sp. LB1]|uniref:hypothetical protein n=1 Tax=Salinisphaera sp. LB1 TaxID=2183911 RepID=UPI000D7050DF|nr:hypothetical protein [Salinisphaera sp. LB1]AWN16741.1 hypothetical protein SALB1_2543 [Salinisphaera sp. LB1]
MNSAEHDNAPAFTGEATLGLIPAPDLPETVVASIVAGLPERLHQCIDDRLTWHVETVTDPLIGAEDETRQILSKAGHIKQARGWQYVVCVTDLPMLRNRRLTIAEADGQHGTGVLSQPALGFLQLKRRLQDAILQLVNEMHHGSSDAARDRQQVHIAHQADRYGHGSEISADARELVGSRYLRPFVSLRRLTPDDSAVDVRFVTASRWRGYIQLLLGMVYANRPWTILPSFRRVVAIAFATGTYGLVFPTLWHLSDAYDRARLLALMALSFIAMIAWITIAHGLWEPRSANARFTLVWLYNATTLTTLLIGVACYYVALFCLFFTTALIFIPDHYLQQVLQHPAGLYSYVVLAWLITSVATITGALGLSLEGDATVRNATYGYRQRMRHRKVTRDSASSR